MKIFTSGIREKFGMIKFGFEVNRDFYTRRLRNFFAAFGCCRESQSKALRFLSAQMNYKS